MPPVFDMFRATPDGAVTVAGGSLHTALAKGAIDRLEVPKSIL